MSTFGIMWDEILKPPKKGKSITNYKYRKPAGPHDEYYCEHVGCDCSKVLELKSQKYEGTATVYCKYIDNNCMIVM